MPPIGSPLPIRRPEPAAVVRTDRGAVLHLQAGDSFLSKRKKKKSITRKTVVARWLGVRCQNAASRAKLPAVARWVGGGGQAVGRKAESSKEGRGVQGALSLRQG